MTAEWTGNRSRAARRLIRARGRYQQCWRCGTDLDLVEDEWHAGHVIARSEGGSDLDVQAECTRCNLADGGRRGARITNARARATRRTDQRLVSW